jgi:hypothetical protein
MVSWLALAAAVWAGVSLAAGLLIGKAVAHAEAEAHRASAEPMAEGLVLLR